MKEELIAILEEICPGVDFENEKKIVDNGIIDSLNIFSLILEINEKFDISIGAENLKPEYFNSVEAMIDLINRLKENN